MALNAMLGLWVVAHVSNLLGKVDLRIDRKEKAMSVSFKIQGVCELVVQRDLGG